MVEGPSWVRWGRGVDGIGGGTSCLALLPGILGIGGRLPCGGAATGADPLRSIGGVLETLWGRCVSDKGCGVVRSG